MPPGLASAWRWPVGNAKYPDYVQRKFRLKAMIIASLQLLCVLAIMCFVRVFNWDQRFASEDPTTTTTSFGAMVAALVLSLLLLDVWKTDYPRNYVMLLVVTVLGGLVWGVGGVFLGDNMHFQIVGIMCITTMVAAVAMYVLSRWKRGTPYEVVMLSTLLAWAVASAVDLTVASMYSADKLQCLGSIGLTFFFVMIFLLQSGPLLVECEPDSFMKLVLTMDATLLFMVALPVLWTCSLTFCVTSFLQPVRDEDAPADAEAV